MSMINKMNALMMLSIFLILLLWPIGVWGNQNYSTAKKALAEAKKLHSQYPGIPIVVIARGVYERGYRTYIDSSYLGRQSLVIGIPTYVGRGDDIYCAMLDHLRGLQGRGNRLLNNLNKIQEQVGDINTSIFHSGAVVALKNVASSSRFKEVFQKGKMGKVAFAGAYAGPQLSRAMNHTGIPWQSFAYNDDMVVAITRTNLQGLGLSGEFRLTPLQLLLAPMRVPASALGGAFKVPHLLLFKAELNNHPLQSYKADIVSWLPDSGKPEKDMESEREKDDREPTLSRKQEDSYSGDGNGPDGGGNGGSDGGDQNTISDIVGDGKLNCRATTQEDGSLKLEMQKNTSGPLIFMIPNATPLKTNSGAQALGM